MIVRAYVAAMAMLLLAPALAQEAAPPSCAPTDQPCLERVMRSHPVRQLEMWRADLARPLNARVGAAPTALVEYLTLDNLSHGYPQRPRRRHAGAGLPRRRPCRDRGVAAAGQAAVRRAPDRHLPGRGPGRHRFHRCGDRPGR